MNDDSDIPNRNPSTEQEDREIDPRTFDNGGNMSPSEFRLDTAALFTQATEQTRMALCMSDPHAPDAPIVYVNEAFVRLTGYSREEVLGRNCRFLQGEDTDPASVEKIRQCLADEAVVVVDILNYRKDGTAFWNALHIGPIHDEHGKLQYYYGSQWDITEILDHREESRLQEAVNEELRHRTGNLFAIINAIVALSARGADDAQALADKITGRLKALQHAHSTSIADDAQVRDLSAMVDQVLAPYRTDRQNRIALAGGDVILPLSAITPLGISLHELATNAVKYGSLSKPEGTVCVDWDLEDQELTICWIEKGGPVPEDKLLRDASGTGSRIVKGVLAQIGGTISMSFKDDGLNATITIPLATAS
ncbi:PAS domain-containing protein [Aurantiacibacter aquimixticola]|uniref:PAS domain-containing protein n=1 Tax=Aurantiacibacter aquimixticola TaxID=1958945 RepID=UPI001402C919|nr:PAS domain-containing protein [Aurantiacibacter aquimixticola]